MTIATRPPLLHLSSTFTGVIIHSITDGTKSIMVSDAGSLKLDLGTAAYHINDSSQGDDVSVEGLLQVPELPRDLTSHCCELGGLYGIVTVIKMSISTVLLQDGSIEQVGCDNKASLCIFNLSCVLDPQQPD